MGSWTAVATRNPVVGEVLLQTGLSLFRTSGTFGSKGVGVIKIELVLDTFHKAKVVGPVFKRSAYYFRMDRAAAISSRASPSPTEGMMVRMSGPGRPMSQRSPQAAKKRSLQQEELGISNERLGIEKEGAICEAPNIQDNSPK